jgi:hypothetical protein
MCHTRSITTAGWQRNRGSIRRRGEDSSVLWMSRQNLEPSSPCYSMGNAFFPQRLSDRSVKMAIHLHVVSRLRMSGGIPQRPSSVVFMVCTRTTLLSPFLLRFTGAVGSSDYKVSNGRMISEEWFRKGVDGHIRAQFGILFPNLSGKTKKNRQL